MQVHIAHPTCGSQEHLGTCCKYLLSTESRLVFAAVSQALCGPEGHNPMKCCGRCYRWGDFLREEVLAYGDHHKRTMADQRREYNRLMRNYDRALLELEAVRNRLSAVLAELTGIPGA